MFSRFPKFFLQNQHFAAKFPFFLYVDLFSFCLCFCESSVEYLFSSCFYVVSFFSELCFMFSRFVGLLFLKFIFLFFIWFLDFGVL